MIIVKFNSSKAVYYWKGGTNRQDFVETGTAQSLPPACYTFRYQDVYVLTGDLKARSKSEGGFCLNLDAASSP